jgi:hypothetical protein
MDVLFLWWPPTEEKLQAAYRRQSLRHHPDRGGTHEDFIRLKAARDTVAAALAEGLPTEDSVRREAEAKAKAKAEERDAQRRWREWRTQATEYERFLRGFRESRRGNLWRKFDELTLTVFERDGRFSWCISSGEDNTRFSRWRGFEGEEEAMEDLWEQVR